MSQSQSVFSKIYATNYWDFGSGPGSLEVHTRGYREFLQKFLSEYKISSVVDVGCGDWQIARHINWEEIHYTGIDVVQDIITRNKELYGNERTEFICADVFSCDLPVADLLIVKDVLQHWPNKDIIVFLSRLTRFKYALITNCILGSRVNADIALGQFRPLDLNAPPFNYDFPKVYEFTNNSEEICWKKAVYLLKSMSQGPHL
jgi:SAM-dependent methyltransferase